MTGDGDGITPTKAADTVTPEMGEATEPPEPAATPEPPTPTPVPYWISGVQRCPSSDYYGELETETAGLYSEIDMGPQNQILRMPHGSRVVYYPEESTESMCRIEFKGRSGYVQCMFLVTYDPATGVQPDESQCW
jgi:hypothetical protein